MTSPEQPPVSNSSEFKHRISIVVPVYQGERTLPSLLQEIAAFREPSVTPDGNSFAVTEVLLVFDHGPDGSANVIRALESEYSFVRGVWLSRNFGQHAATLAGMASSGGDWIVTLDEDGQHNPADIPGLLDTAMSEGASVVYAKPINEAPHGTLRNASSKSAKWILSRVFGSENAADYQSFRLVLGSIGRSVAAYSGSGVYLDVAMGWIANRTATSPVTLRQEGDRRSGYSTRRLLSHFLRMVLSTGTRGLRVVSALGVIFAVIGVLLTIFIFVQRLFGGVSAEGWASTIVVILLSSGATLFSLGVIAEYIGVNVNMAMGKPPYVVVTDPADGPLGRKDTSHS